MEKFENTAVNKVLESWVKVTQHTETYPVSSLLS